MDFLPNTDVKLLNLKLSGFFEWRESLSADEERLKVSLAEVGDLGVRFENH